MKTSRRDFMKGSLASLTLVGGGVSLLSGCTKETSVAPPSTGQPLFPGPDRLPVEWYKKTINKLQGKLAEQGVSGVLCADALNINYLSGYFHSKTERPEYLWVPTKGEPFLYVPGLDRDLVTTWWIKDYEWYFDFPTAEKGGFDNPQGTRDHLVYVLKAIDKRGYDTKVMGIEHEAGPTTMDNMKKALPHSSFKPVGKLVHDMRIRKTPEEIELMRRAQLYEDKALEFAREYVLKHGTDTTDYEVGMMATKYGTDLLMRDIKRDGRPHTAVGCRIGISCRCGVGTAYPHPNQVHHNRIQKGQAMQFSGGGRIGGYGGEGYRACHILPIPDLAKKMWEVHTEMTLMQAELQIVGAVARDIAKKIIDHARNAGLEKYIYHRPAHGIGMEGHQAPYLAFGDYTVLEEGMAFSNEPGLYNPEGGYGYNHGGTIITRPERGEVLNKTPLTKEWCWLTI